MGKFKNMNLLTALYIYECLVFVFKNMDEFNSGGIHNYTTKTNDLIY